MNPSPIYLDHNATTPVAPSVRAAIVDWLGAHAKGGFGNPSSGHAFGREARAAIDEARGRVASLIGARPREIVFTGSGTEADNMVVFGVGPESPHPGRAVLSAVEHPGVAEPAAILARRGWTVDFMPVDDQGRVDLDASRELLRRPAHLVSVMTAQNETGAIQPVAAIAEQAKAAGALVHSDGAQAVGKIPVDVEALGVDFLTIVGHKFYAPKGVGALYCREGAMLRPLLVGGGQERGLRPGTENVAFIVGLGVAAELASRSLTEESERQAALVLRLEGGLGAKIPGLVRTLDPGRGAVLPGTLHLQFPSCDAQALLAACPSVAASRGSACHTETEGPPSILQLMGRDVDSARGAIRLSVGRGTTEDEVDRAIASLATAWLATRA